MAEFRSGEILLSNEWQVRFPEVLDFQTAREGCGLNRLQMEVGKEGG